MVLRSCFLEYGESRKFVHDLMTIVGNEVHTFVDLDLTYDPGHNKFKSLITFSTFVLNQILNGNWICNDDNDDGSDSDDDGLVKKGTTKIAAEGTRAKPKFAKKFVINYRRESLAAASNPVTPQLIPGGFPGRASKHTRRAGLKSGLSVAEMDQKRFSFSSRGMLSKISDSRPNNIPPRKNSAVVVTQVSPSAMKNRQSKIMTANARLTQISSGQLTQKSSGGFSLSDSDDAEESA